MPPIATDFRDWNVKWVTSTTKEATYGVAVTPLEKTGLFKGPDMATRTPEIITDDDQIGKGHDFTDSQVIHSWSTGLSRQWDASIYWVGWAFAFAMGVDTMTELGTADTPPDAPFTHAIRFQDEDVSKQLPSATIAELIGDNTDLEQLLYTGMVVNEVTLSATGKNRLQLAMTLLGDGKRATDITDIDALTAPTEEYLRGSNVQLNFAGTDLANYVKGWSVKISNNLMADDGYVLGTDTDLGLFRERLFFGKRTVEVALTLLIPPAATKDVEALLNAQTIAPIIISAFGQVTSVSAIGPGTSLHQVILTVTDFRLTGRPKAVDNNQMIYNISGTAMFTLADVGPLKVEVISDLNEEYLTATVLT